MPPALYFFKTKTLSFSNLDIYCFLFFYSLSSQLSQNICLKLKERISQRDTLILSMSISRSPHISAPPLTGWKSQSSHKSGAQFTQYRKKEP